MFSCNGPVLSVCWNKVRRQCHVCRTGAKCWCHSVQEGNKVIAGGADNAARMVDLQANPNQAQQVAQHDAPIKVVKWIESPQGGILATGSWDKTVKVSMPNNPPKNDHLTACLHQYWDLRTSSPIATVQLPERCYSLDVVYPLMVVGCAERHIQIFNLTNPSTAFKVRSVISGKLSGGVDSIIWVDHAITTEMANSRCILLHAS